MVNEIEDKDIVSDGPCSIALYDQWVTPPVLGPRPRARYEVLPFHVPWIPLF